MALIAVIFTCLVASSNAAILKHNSSQHVAIGRDALSDSSSFLQKVAHGLSEDPEPWVTDGEVDNYGDVHFNAISGGTAGIMFGSIMGGIAGYTRDAPGPGGLIGGFSGGVIGGAIGWLWSEADKIKQNSGGETDMKKTKEKVAVTTKELPQPALEKMRQQAAVAVALSDYEQERAEKKGDKHESIVEKAAEQKAIKALGDLSRRVAERNETGEKEAMAENEKDFENVQEVLSQGDTADMVTAEAAMANGAAVTANDLARVAGGGKGKRVRGEDLGPNGDEPSYQGDMVPGDEKQMALFQTLSSKFSGHHHGNQTPGVAAGVAWTKGKVKFCFASDIPSSVRHIFLAACRQYHKAVPCLTFEDVGWVRGSSTSPAHDQKCKESPAIFVQSNPREGCYSYVGMVGHFQSQRLQLQAPGCLSVGTAIHELGHALGMAHEQSRPDRNKFVKIHWDNIKGNNAHNFDIVDKAYTEEHYDLLSIMHYDRFAFAKNPDKPTIEYVGEGVHDELGQRAGLSKYDVSQVVAMYKDMDRDCNGNALAGMGCVNRPDDQGKDMCNITKCNQKAASHCCACGGGVAVQCYKGQACPKSDPLPDLDASECMQDATHLFPGQGIPCVYTNVCKFNVGFTCSAGCKNTAGPKNYEATQCNGQFVTDICSAKDKCKVIKLD